MKTASHQNNVITHIHNYNSINSKNRISQRLNRDDTPNTLVRSNTQKIISVTEMGNVTNSVRKINNNNNIDKNIISLNANNLTDIERRNNKNLIDRNLEKLTNPNNNNNYDYEEECEKEKKEILMGKVLNETEDWTDALKQSNLSREEFMFYSKNRGLAKIVDLIENLNKLIRDKNFTIRILLEENKALNQRNEDLIKDYGLVNHQNMHLLKESLKNGQNQNKNNRIDTAMDSSMVKKYFLFYFFYFFFFFFF